MRWLHFALRLSLRCSVARFSFARRVRFLSTIIASRRAPKVDDNAEHTSRGKGLSYANNAPVPHAAPSRFRRLGFGPVFNIVRCRKFSLCGGGGGECAALSL